MNNGIAYAQTPNLFLRVNLHVALGIDVVLYVCLGLAFYVFFYTAVHYNAAPERDLRAPLCDREGQ